ncbi:YeiH family protein [Ferruginivarius sediminum]|nr:putative sulfate exporter family transporter [Ferruginivarius sediminum]
MTSEIRPKFPGTVIKRMTASLVDLWPGLLTSLTIAVAAMFVSSRYGGPTLLFALLLGIAFNFLSDHARVMQGVEFASRTVLRIGVALLGARIGVEQILQVGWVAVVLIVGMVPLTILFGRLIARRLDQSGQMGILTGGAVAICGASAALAISSVLPPSRSRERDTLFTVVGVTTLSTICMVFYPAVLSLFDLSDVQAGYIIGASVHDVAQVVGAGYVISEQAGDTATLTKLLRVAMLIPTTLILAFAATRFVTGGAGGAGKARVKVPTFLIGFVILAVMANLSVLPPVAVEAASTASSWCLVTAIAALGVKTAIKDFLELGWRPVALMVVETAFLAAAVATAVIVGGSSVVVG